MAKGRPTKLTKKRLDTIVALLEEDEYPIDEICRLVKIHRDTWYHWKVTIPMFSDSLRAAEEKRLEKIRISARKGLAVLLEGKEWEETTTEGRLVKDKDGNEVFKTTKAKKVTKFILPNPDMVKFALRNLDRENFKDGSEHDGGDGNRQPDKPVSIKLPDGIMLEI